MTAIPPGATIGILGGGQLGRMTAQAARTMGYKVHALDPAADCPAHAVVDRLITAPFDDADAAADLARQCDVITLEIEQIAPAALHAALQFAPVRPAPAIIAQVQHRGRQKAWLTAHGFPLAPYRDVQTLADMQAAISELGSCYVKSCHGGYDGRSQLRVDSVGACADAWRALGEREAVAEQALDLEMEISVMVARRPSGETMTYAPALNHHTNQVLSWSVLPAPLPDALTAHARDIALGIAGAMELEGLLGVEMFRTRAGDLLVNELAPRPHNSFHASERACPTSQFEQAARRKAAVATAAMPVSRSPLGQRHMCSWCRARSPRPSRHVLLRSTLVSCSGHATAMRLVVRRHGSALRRHGNKVRTAL